MTSTIDHQMPLPTGWRTAFLKRSLPALQCYTLLASLILTSIFVYTVTRAAIGRSRSTQELAANPSQRAAILSRREKNAVAETRTIFCVALVYMANACMFIAVDGVIAFLVLSKDVKSNPDVWTWEMISALALYCVYLFVLFMASFVFIPLVQMLASTWGLTRFSKKNVLSDYVPQARRISTLAAMMWAVFSFCFAATWSSVGKETYPALRFTVIEACLGSATAWLEASFIFNYCAANIGDSELNGGNGVTEVGRCQFIFEY